MIEFWNQRYSEPEYAYGTEPNDFFREQLRLLPPGRILLPGEGEGRNAVHAALNGWKADAVDYSAEGAQKALALAERGGVTLSYFVQDLAEFLPANGIYDAVALLFVHLPSELRIAVHSRAVEALRPGGVLILEAFTPGQLAYGSGGPREERMLYTAEQLSEDFRGLDIHHVRTLVRTLHEGPFHEGDASVVQIVGIRH